MEKKIFILVLSLLLLGSTVFAETVFLKSGRTVEGKITERTDKYIKVDIGIGMPITYFLDEIDKIEGEPSTSSTKEIEGNYYVNEEYGISVIFPTNWHIYEGENLRKTIESELKLMGQTYSDYEKSNEKILVKVFKYPYGSPGKLNSNIIISAVNIRNYSEKINNPLDYLNLILPPFQTMKNFNLLQKPEVFVISGIELAKMSLEVDFVENIKLKYDFLCFMRNDKVIILNLSSDGNKEDEDTFQSVIKSLKIS